MVDASLILMLSPSYDIWADTVADERRSNDVSMRNFIFFILFSIIRFRDYPYSVNINVVEEVIVVIYDIEML